MNANDLVLVFTCILVGIGLGVGLVRYGERVGIDLVYKIKRDAPMDKLTTPTEQDDTFEEDVESE